MLFREFEMPLRRPRRTFRRSRPCGRIQWHPGIVFLLQGTASSRGLLIFWMREKAERVFDSASSSSVAKWPQ